MYVGKNGKCAFVIVLAVVASQCACDALDGSGCGAECVEGLCVAQFDPQVVYFQPYYFSDANGHESTLLRFRPPEEELDCDVPIACLLDGATVLGTCQLGPDDRQTWDFAITCSGQDVVIDVTRHIESGEALPFRVALRFDSTDRLVEFQFSTDETEQLRAYRYLSLDGLVLEQHTLALAYPASNVETQTTLEMDSAGIPARTVTLARGEVVYDGSYTYSIEEPSRMIVHAVDLDGDSATDSTDRFIYDATGKLVEMKIERRGADDAFVPVSNCCNDICGGNALDAVDLPNLK
jgi:hypothetical protein